MSLPRPDTHCFDEDTKTDCWSYSKELVLSMMAEREAKITELETELASMAAVIAKKDEALQNIKDELSNCNWRGDLQDSIAEALALTADSVEVVKVDLLGEPLDPNAEYVCPELYTIKVKQ